MVKGCDINVDPHPEYTQRLQARHGRVRRYERLDDAVAHLRLGIAVLFLVLAWLALFRGAFSRWWLALPVIAFCVLIVLHEQVKRNGRRCRRAVSFYEIALARVEERWIDRSGPTQLFRDDLHLYAKDLDIFGKGSLFELLCTARTSSGEETLATWLSEPASQSEVLGRQAAVEELRYRLDLREHLALLGADVRASIHPESMSRWGNEPTVLEGTWPRLAAAAIGAFAAVTFALRAVTFLRYLFMSSTEFMAASAWLSMAGLAAAGSFGLWYQKRVRRVMSAVEQPEKDLELFSLLLRRIETEKFTTRKLVELQSTLRTKGHSPSHHIARLARLTELLDSRHNQFFGLFSYVLLWATQLAFAIESWRKQCGPRVGPWLATVGEFEALSSLASYAYEHPSDPFPEIVEGETIFEGNDLRHPLLPFDKCVPNTLCLNSHLQLLVVSGSNMSGKSTLLRTVGVNTVLALAGAPVRASRLRVSSVLIGATLRIQDSLQAGVSRFYTEIQRIRQIMDLTKTSLPVLFLLDEILHGTNSHDRAVGAEAIVRGLIDRGAIGLVTTHDLALARVADALAPRAANVHFEDHLEHGNMVFDYRLRSGVVEKSNALALMRAVGLNV
jgi:hypothetical protein